MFAKFSRLASLFALVAALSLAAPRVMAQPEVPSEAAGKTYGEAATESAVGADHTDDEGGHGEEKGPRPVFEPEHGTWFNIFARNIFASPQEKQHMKDAEVHNAELKQRVASGQKLNKEEEEELKEGVHYVAKYDFLLYTPLLWALLAIFMVSAAKKAKIRPAGKPASGANLVEAAVDGFQDYLIGVMGNKLARKYTPLIASFFFTILVSNWLGLVPGMVAASAQPAIPIAMAIVAFFAVHIIAIKETSFKSWFTHFLGEPLWLAPLNFPLHLVGELIKPLSLSLRLLCNVFGEEAVVATLAGLAITMLPAWLPIPFQLPMLFLGTFFGFLQALVFSTLLAIYISILATAHDDHDAHNGHGHVDHEEHKGRRQIVAHPSEMSVG
ncbi:ATP synthase subunit 6 [Abditibacterium utsteinense]|uniref:ATP synthase subunit a n=1 Tax=Abditibacterium utsteinense TaxID=1960156 RepID=A0A2S8SV92_9BACT|nr:F0F1 ATP synthase subunit A [Abditibacterium utsteinense]PQV64710.1 ATP synthase subunit 6 [Abditibacterium utsteinense]